MKSSPPTLPPEAEEGWGVNFFDDFLGRLGKVRWNYRTYIKYLSRQPSPLLLWAIAARAIVTRLRLRPLFNSLSFPFRTGILPE